MKITNFFLYPISPFWGIFIRTIIPENNNTEKYKSIQCSMFDGTKEPILFLGNKNEKDLFLVICKKLKGRTEPVALREQILKKGDWISPSSYQITDMEAYRLMINQISSNGLEKKVLSKEIPNVVIFMFDQCFVVQVKVRWLKAERAWCFEIKYATPTLAYFKTDEDCKIFYY